MNHSENGLSGERSNQKTSGVFTDRAKARQTATAIRSTLGLGDAQVLVIDPEDPMPGRKMEPESRGIGRTLVLAHVKLGLAGALIGAIAFGILYGVVKTPMVVHSPVAAALAVIGFGAVLGLMAGGLVALRPDHAAYIDNVREGLAEGRVAVVVHAFDRDQQQRASALLREAGAETVETL